MENPTPTPERRRRTERFRDTYEQPAPEPVQRTQPVYPPQPPQPVRQLQPRSAFIPQEAPPPVMARPPRPAPVQEKSRKAAKRLPVWVLSLNILLVFVLMGLFAAQSLMQANLVQRQEERNAAYESIVARYPIYYMDLIAKYAEEYNLRPAFVAAIIMNESSFRSDAESSVGARGLMQLMPDTAEWIAGKLDVSGYSFERMYDPESNIRFGCWYLNYLSRLFRGDPILVACAFHAGQSNVTAWLSNKDYSSDGMSIALEDIPMADSKTYAGRVTKAYGIYDALYYHAFNDAATFDGPHTLSVSADSLR